MHQSYPMMFSPAQVSVFEESNTLSCKISSALIRQIPVLPGSSHPGVMEVMRALAIKHRIILSCFDTYSEAFPH